jgi:cysteinyl-tRNA synthetase
MTCDTPFVHVWMHNGFVRVNDEKMSKSLGNFFTVREVLPRLRPEVLRAFVLASHYRGPINYGEDNLRQADSALQRLYLALRDVEKGDATLFPTEKRVASPFSRRFSEAMNDDFNTPDALAAMQSLARELNVAKAAGDGPAASAYAAELRTLGAILGLLGQRPEDWLATHSELTGAADSAAGRPEPAEIDRLVAARTDARQTRNWAESDHIRDELAGHGVMLEDGPAGTSWRWR